MGKTSGFTKAMVKTEVINKGEDNRSVSYRGTEVLRVTADKIILNHGGYVTATTVARMNQASNEWGLGVRISRHYEKMYAEYRGEKYAFTDNKLELPR